MRVPPRSAGATAMTDWSLELRAAVRCMVTHNLDPEAILTPENQAA